MENLQDNINNENLQNVDFNIFNALNLYNEDLGQCYLQNGFNPFDVNFTLDENYISDVLENEKNKKDISCPQFLEQSDFKISKSFDMSFENVSNLLSQATTMLYDKNITPEMKKLLQKLIATLKMFLELNKKYKSELKKKKNRYQMFINMISLNWFLSEEMALSFTQEFDSNKIISKISELALNYNKENNILKEQARQIIESNKKIYEQKQEKAPSIKTIENATRIEQEILQEQNKYQEELKNIQAQNAQKEILNNDYISSTNQENTKNVSRKQNTQNQTFTPNSQNKDDEFSR